MATLAQWRAKLAAVPTNSTAVAGSTSRPSQDPQQETTVADGDTESEADTTGGRSIAGDTVDSSGAESSEPSIPTTAVAARRPQRNRAPLAPRQGETRGRSAWRNSDKEVGNFGLFVWQLGAAGHTSQHCKQRIANTDTIPIS